MKKEKLEEKYGKELISKIINKGCLEGCTIAINKDGTEDIPEIDIIHAIREMKGEKLNDFEWD